MRFSLYALGSIMFFSMRVHAAASCLAVVIGWVWPGCQPGKRSENVDSGVISGESPKDTDSPLFVRPPWQARLLHPH